jgi:hypothetical protein
VGAGTNRSLSVFNFCAIISVETLPWVCSGTCKGSKKIKHDEVREVRRERKRKQWSGGGNIHEVNLDT